MRRANIRIESGDAEFGVSYLLTGHEEHGSLWILQARHLAFGGVLLASSLRSMAFVERERGASGFFHPHAQRETRLIFFWKVYLTSRTRDSAKAGLANSQDHLRTFLQLPLMRRPIRSFLSLISPKEPKTSFNKVERGAMEGRDPISAKLPICFM